MYSESKDGQVILTMSREDWEWLEYFLQVGIDAAVAGGVSSEVATDDLMNRLNQGNPHYTPYQVEATK